MVLLSPTVVALAYAFIALAVLAGVLAVSVLGRLAVVNRSIRLARRQSLRAYYGRLVLSH